MHNAVDLTGFYVLEISFSPFSLFRSVWGVAVLDALIGYYQILHTCNWSKTLFHYFVDIAVVNVFLLHKDLCTTKGQAPMMQKTFRAEQLTLTGS